jgi:uncharacterized membrane protein
MTCKEIISINQNSIDYREMKESELLEQFSLKYLNTIELKENETSKSIILAPYNSSVKGSILPDLDILNEEILYDFNNKAREVNMNYMNNNNKEFNNGIVILKKNSNLEHDKSLNNEKPFEDFEEDNKTTFKNILLNSQNILNENAINEVINIGYAREYLLRLLKNNECNYATATYSIINNLSK